ncbi:TPA: SprT-like domain-containing protein [Pseudomonas aeruginosa]
MKFKRPTEEAYEELQAAYDYYNDHLFEALLPPCLITFQREKRSMGYFSKSRFIRRDGVQTDEIAMNPDFFAVVPLVEILQTLVHEMAHLWQAHFGTPSRACYHNREWALKMERIGLMPSDTGQPGGKKVGQSMNDYVILGGRFDKVTRQLLERGFAISWMDRYPSPYRSASAPVGTSWTAIEAASEQQGAEEERGIEPVESVALHIAAALQIPAHQGLDVTIRETGDRSNRVKYSCPSCKTNVWGKPGLKLICEPCEMRLD